MRWFAMIGVALTATLATAGCVDTIAALRGDGVVGTMETVQQPQSIQTVLAGPNAPRQGDRGRGNGSATEVDDRIEPPRPALRKNRQNVRPPAFTRRLNTADTTTRRLAPKQSNHPAQGSLVPPKPAAEPTSPLYQARDALPEPQAIQPLGSGLPSAADNQPPRPATAQTVAPRTPQDDSVQTSSLPKAEALPLATAEGRKFLVDRSSPEPSVTRSEPAPARVQPDLSRPAAQAGTHEPDPPSVPERSLSATAEASAPRVASIEPAGAPFQTDQRQPERKALVLYLAVLDEIRSLSDLNSKTVALGAQERSVETAIKQAFAVARVTPSFVIGSEPDTLDQLVRRKVAAATLVVAPRTADLSGLPAMLSQLGLHLLEVPLPLPPP